MSENHYGADDERIQGLYDHLVENNVKLSIRRGTLRFAFHLYNNQDDVARVVELSRSFLRR